MARFLVIEDNSDSAELMAYLLGAFGHTVTTAPDGEQGLEMLASVTVDLIICDVHLPRMDGCDVVQTVKRTPGLDTIPVVAVTALAMVGDQKRMLTAGFDGYISKPIVPEDFVRQIEAFLPAGAAPAGQRAHASNAPSDSQPTPRPAGPRVLVVDDNKANRELTRAILEPSGYRVTLSASVASALKAVTRQSFDLILCDLRLPDQDGVDMLAIVKQDHRLRSIPFLIITASRWADSDRRRALKLGALRFLLRPIEPRELLSEIAVCLQSRAVH